MTRRPPEPVTSTGAWSPRTEHRYPAVYEAPHVPAADLGGDVEGLLSLPA